MCGASTVGWINDLAGIGTSVATVGLAAKSLMADQPKAASAQAPDSPGLDDAQKAADKERRRLSLARGAKSTNVTKGQFEDSSLFVTPTLGGR